MIHISRGRAKDAPNNASGQGTYQQGRKVPFLEYFIKGILAERTDTYYYLTPYDIVEYTEYGHKGLSYSNFYHRIAAYVARCVWC